MPLVFSGNSHVCFRILKNLLKLAASWYGILLRGVNQEKSSLSLIQVYHTLAYYALEPLLGSLVGPACGPPKRESTRTRPASRLVWGSGGAHRGEGTRQRLRFPWCAKPWRPNCGKNVENRGLCNVGKMWGKCGTYSKFSEHV